MCKAHKVGEILHDVDIVEATVVNLLDEQLLQDQRLLTLEQDSRQLLEDVEGTYGSNPFEISCCLVFVAFNKCPSVPNVLHIAST